MIFLINVVIRDLQIVLEDRRFAILIGASEFGRELGVTNLRCPPADVDGIYDLLTSPETGTFSRENVFKLLNKPHYEINRHINVMGKRATPDDVLLVYYSGHGKQDMVGRLYLITTDTLVDTLETSSVSLDVLRTIFELSPCRRIIIILDCCFSGAAGSSFLRSSAYDQLKMFARAQGIYLLTASTRIQAAEEKEGDRYAVFTKHLIAGVRSGHADMNRDGFVSMDELLYVHKHVTFEAHQEPERYFLRGRGELVFARSPSSPLGGEARDDAVSAAGPQTQIRLKLEMAWSAKLFDSACMAAAVSPREAFGAVGHGNGTVSILGLRDGVVRQQIEGKAPIWCLAWSPTGNHLAWVNGEFR